MSRTGKPHSGPTWPQVDSLPLVSFECQGQDSPLATAATSKGRCECHGWGSPPSSHVRLHKQLGTSKSGSDQHMVLMSGPGQPKLCQHRGNPPEGQGRGSRHHFHVHQSKMQYSPIIQILSKTTFYPVEASRIHCL